LYDAETWTLQRIDQKHPEGSEMCCCRRMVKISWTNHVKNEEVLNTVKRKEASYIQQKEG
jgi:hypothetical protein